MLSYYNSFNKKGLVISDDASPTLRAYHKYQEMKAKDPNDPNLMEYLKNPDFVPKSEVKQPAPEDKAKESSKVEPKAEKKVEPIDTSKVGNSFWSSKGLPKGTDPNSKQAWMWAVELRNNWPDLYEHPENTTNSIAKPLFEQARDIIEGKDSYGNLSDEEKDAIDAEEAKGIKDRQKQAAQAKKKEEEAKPQPTPSDVVTERPSREAAGDDYVGQYNKYLDYLDTAEKTDKMVDDILDTRDDLEDRINDSKNPEEKEALKKLFARARNISIF